MNEITTVREAFSLLKRDHANFISRNEQMYIEDKYNSCTRIREIEKLENKIIELLRNN